MVKRKTASDRFSRAVRSIDSWCRANRHRPLSEQQQKLNEKLRGHYAYYGVTGNARRAVAVPLGSRTSLAEVAQSPQPPTLDDLADVSSTPPAIPAGPRPHVRSIYAARSEPMT